MSEHTGPFVLRETLASRSRGKSIFFCRMTGIGPMNTASIDEAARFDTREDALLSPASRHLLSFYEPEPLSMHLPEGGAA